jgi:hypothetical protein
METLKESGAVRDSLQMTNCAVICTFNQAAGARGRQRWSCFFDQFAALLRWIRFSFQAANFIGSVLLAYASLGVKMPCVEWGRSAL